MRSSIRRALPVAAVLAGLGLVVPGCTSPVAPPPSEEQEEDPPEGPNEGSRALATLDEGHRIA